MLLISIELSGLIINVSVQDRHRDDYLLTSYLITFYLLPLTPYPLSPYPSTPLPLYPLIYPLLIAASLDYLIGDPWGWLHPVQVMGWAISKYTQLALKYVDRPYWRRDCWGRAILGVNSWHGGN